MADTFLSVVDADDVVVGRALRSVIHQTGLRHREVHVWLLTPTGDVVLQKRGPNKDTYPNLLDASAGGHVEEGQDYMAAALTEAHEELGLTLSKDDLVPLAKIDIEQIDAAYGAHNLVYRMVYLHRYAGTTADLQVEAEDGAGFITVPLRELTNGGGTVKDSVVPGLLQPAYRPIWEAFENLMKAK